MVWRCLGLNSKKPQGMIALQIAPVQYKTNVFLEVVAVYVANKGQYLVLGLDTTGYLDTYKR